MKLDTNWKRCLSCILVGLVCLGIVGCRGRGKKAESGWDENNSRFVMDGEMDAGCGEAVLAESGVVGRGPFGRGIDIKEVYIANDADFLYLYMRTEPSVAGRYDEKHTSGTLCSLFIDADNDPATGCVDFKLFGYGLISGFERKVLVPLGVVAGWELGRGNYEDYFIMYEGQEWSGDAWQELPKLTSSTDESFSGDAPQRIADGPDGVEMCIPLKQLNVRPGQTIRILLQENADCFVKESCNFIEYQVKE